MREQEVRDLYEAYLQVHQPQEEVEKLDEISKELAGRVVNARIAKTGAAFDREMKDRTPENMRDTVDAVDKETRAKRLAAGVRNRRNAKQNVNASYEYDTFDTILEYLVAEGYANTNKNALAIMANMSEEWRQDIMEISQKTATNAYALSKTGEFEGADSDRDIKRTDNLEKHIKRKFGDKAVKHAERAADAQTFGRKDASGKSKQRPKPRIEKSDYRTTQDGKMHKQDQKELKTELRIKRDRRLRAAEDN